MMATCNYCGSDRSEEVGRCPGCGAPTLRLTIMDATIGDAMKGLYEWRKARVAAASIPLHYFGALRTL